MAIFPVVSSYHVNTVDENIIGAPKMRNNYVAIQSCTFLYYSL